MVNPYDFSRPVRDPAMFSGRAHLLQEVLDGVRQGYSFAIAGTTRIGKTSLLVRLQQALLEQMRIPGTTLTVPVLLSIREIPDLSPSTIYRQIVTEFAATLPVPDLAAWRRGVRLLNHDLREDEAFAEFHSALDTLMLSRDVHRRLVIMIDDADELRSHRWSQDFFARLHSLAGPSPGDRIAIVVTGSSAQSLYEVTGSSWVDIVRTKTIGLLSRDEITELAVKPTGLQLDSSTVSLIFDLTRGHPLLTQCVMKHLFDVVNGDLPGATEGALRDALDHFFHERTDVLDWGSDFTDSERWAYHLIASGSQGATRADLVRELEDQGQVDRAIRLLIQIGAIREESPGSDRFLVGGEMFRRWFYEKLPAVRRPSSKVQFTIYRPNVLRPGEWKTMLAFMHLADRRPDAPPGEPSPVEQVQAVARQTLGEQASRYDRNRADAHRRVPRESEITLVPFVPGLEFRPDRRTFLWVEDVHQEQFAVRAQPEADGTVARGQLAAYLGVILLADVDITIRVDSAHQAGQGDEPVPSSASLYRRVFASYSRKDAEIVRQFELFVEALGDVYLRDIRDIKPGMEWRTRIRELIQGADMFQLFWSKNSMWSPQVREEWEFALSLNRPGFVRPTYWEDPFPESTADGLPPEALRRLHFHRLGGAAASSREGEIEDLIARVKEAMATGNLQAAFSKDVLSLDPSNFPVEAVRAALEEVRRAEEQRREAYEAEGARQAEARRLAELEERRRIEGARRVDVEPTVVLPAPISRPAPQSTPISKDAPAPRSRWALALIAVALFALVGLALLFLLGN